MADPSNRGINFPEPKQSDGGTLGAIKDKAQDVASSVANTAQQAWDSTRHQAQQVASSIGNTAEETYDSVNGFIRRYPLACVFGGFLVGMLVAGGISLPLARRE
jgi:hypothetical protein